MSNRSMGALRLLLGVPFYLVASLVVVPVLLVLVAGVWLLDSGWQVLTDSEGINDDNPVARFYEWYVGLFKFIAFGDDSQGGGQTVSTRARR